MMPAVPDPDDLVGTAYHEAGHAVAACVLGVAIAIVALGPERHAEEDSVSGYIRFGPRPNDLALTPEDPPTLELIEQHVIIDHAGWPAQERATGVKAGIGRIYDETRSHEVLSRLIPDETERRAFLARAEARALQIVTEHWPAVEAVAKALLLQRRLSGDQVQAIFAAVGTEPRIPSD